MTVLPTAVPTTRSPKALTSAVTSPPSSATARLDEREVEWGKATTVSGMIASDNVEPAELAQRGSSNSALAWLRTFIGPACEQAVTITKFPPATWAATKRSSGMILSVFQSPAAFCRPGPGSALLLRDQRAAELRQLVRFAQVQVVVGAFAHAARPSRKTSRGVSRR